MKKLTLNANFLRGCVLTGVIAAASAANAATVVGGSDLFTASYLAQVESWLVNDPQLAYNGPLQFTNIFDKAPSDTSADFHAAADGRGPTIVLMEAFVGTQPVQIIGGFNPQSWSSSNSYYVTPDNADRTAFIFNLSTLDRRDQQTADGGGQYQTFNGTIYGPTFGGGHDLYTYLLTGGYVHTWSYCADPTTSCYGTTNLLGGGSSAPTHFTLGQLEVFTIQGAPLGQTPIPGALPLFATGLGALGLAAWRRKRSGTKQAV